MSYPVNLWSPTSYKKSLKMEVLSSLLQSLPVNVSRIEFAPLVLLMSVCDLANRASVSRCRHGPSVRHGPESTPPPDEEKRWGLRPSGVRGPPGTLYLSFQDQRECVRPQPSLPPPYQHTGHLFLLLRSKRASEACADWRPASEACADWSHPPLLGRRGGQMRPHCSPVSKIVSDCSEHRMLVWLQYLLCHTETYAHSGGSQCPMIVFEWVLGICLSASCLFVAANTHGRVLAKTTVVEVIVSGVERAQ